MAFIREYAELSGDPFSFRIPKRLRKLKVGRALAGVAGHLIPGVGAAVDFARGYGLMAGDPKRKSAAKGPKAKAQAKAVHRAKKASGQHVSGHAKRRGKGGLTGGAVLDIIKQHGGEAIRGATELGKAVLTRGPISAAGGMIGGEFDPPPGVVPIALPGGRVAHMRVAGGHRRTINAANVKALRRAGRRFEAFAKLVKTAAKHTPGLKYSLGMHHGGGHARGRRGHKPGCKCVACR